MKRIPKHDGCCGADSAIAGTNGGCHAMKAPVGTGEYVTRGIINNPCFFIFAYVLALAWRLMQAYT